MRTIGKIRFSTSVTLVSLLFAAPCVAQQRDSTSLRDVLQRAAEARWYLRVTVRDSSFVEGRILRLNDGTVRIERKTVVMDSIVHVEEQMGRSGRGVVGMFTGALIFGAIAAQLSDRDSGGGGLVTTLGIAGLGAGLGMIVGQIADTGRVEWRRIWPPEP